MINPRGAWGRGRTSCRFRRWTTENSLAAAMETIEPFGSFDDVWRVWFNTVHGLQGYLSVLAESL